MGTVLHRFRLLTFVVLVGLALAACGGGDESSDAVQSGGSDMAAYESGAPAPAMDEGEQADYAGGSSALAAAWDRKVIRSADLSLAVTNLDQALVETRRITSDAGGFVFEASTSFEGEYQVGRLTLDVPSERFDNVVASILESTFVERVERETTSSQDVTEEYVDLDSRLRNLQASETRYLGLLEDAERLEDVLTLERELTRVRGEIEQIQGRLRYLDSRTEMSRIVVTLRPSEVAAAASGPIIDLGPAVADAWDASLNFISGALTVVVTVLVFFWWLWPLGGAAAIAFMIWRARRGQATVVPSTVSDSGSQS